MEVSRPPAASHGSRDRSVAGRGSLRPPAAGGCSTSPRSPTRDRDVTEAALRSFAKGESRIHPPHAAFLGGDESQPSLPRGEPGRAAGLELCEPAARGRGFRGTCPGLFGVGPAVRSQGSPRSVRMSPRCGRCRAARLLCCTGCERGTEPPTVPSFQRDLTRVNAELFDPSICQVKPFKSLKAPKKSCMRAGCNVCTCLAVPCCCDAVSEVSRAIVFSQPLVNAELVYSCVRGAGKNPGLLLRKGRSCVRERGTEQYRSPLEPELKPRESSKASRRWFVAVDPGGRMAEPSSRAAGAPGGLRVKETSRLRASRGRGGPPPLPALLRPSSSLPAALLPLFPRATRRPPPQPGMPQPLPPTRLYAAERAAVLTSCVLSALGSGLLVGTHALWPELRTRPRELLLYLSLADLLSALSYFYGVLRNFDGTSWDCVLQGALSTFSNTSSFFWTVAVALYLYVTIVRGSPTGAGLLCCFHIVSWGVPLAITIAAVALKKIGYDASNVSVGWCWVNLDAEDRVLWMLLTGKVWEILAYVTLPVLYILIKRHINRAHAALLEYRPILSSAPALQPWTSTADKKLILIPVIFIILRIWSTVRFILTLCNSPAVQNSVLVVLHGIGNTFQGGANCVMFVLCTRVVRARLLSAICCCHHDDVGWPWRSSSSSRQHPGPAESEDVPDPEQTKPLLPTT